MYAVVVTFRIAPGQMAGFLPLIRANASASVRDEPGCTQFDVASDPDRADEVFLYEVYADRAAFEAHLQTPHFKTFDAATAAMIADKEVRFYRDLHQ